MVARQLFSTMLPVSASASSSISAASSGEPAAGDGADQGHAVGLGEDQQGTAGEDALEILADRDELAALALPDQGGGALAGHDLDRGDREQDLLADHLAQARGGAADADIDQLRQRVPLQFLERDNVRVIARRTSVAARRRR
jgi:hypothetical protein